MKTILAIPGSTRSHSTNHGLIRAIATLVSDRLTIETYDGIGRLPHFDPGLTDAGTPPEVLAFRGMLSAADGVLICTPEYAHGVPGSLKNAIDWTVGSGEFSQKPTVLITASTDGRFGHAALLETLRVIEARNIGQLNLLIPFVRTKVSGDGKITDSATLEAVKTMMNLLIQTINDASK
ncbi:MAG TPA: NADPH-dependent FMN reductase [Puia sp.]|uniref:NADPH-dependent FMN reductase n=1 Tax=Puia sp. TaxID=2045100 RepID=UPI002C868010|nr:NADPH-dependent FMN reductase [Puia sp.]HVU98044.1 NADPH-dependent FMN reductase [Puia sp.]